MNEQAQGNDGLIDLAGKGDASARRDLLERHRDDLRRMVAARLDHRLAARIDPSDVVQEALTEAAQRMDEFLRDRPLPLLGWLRQLAGERVIQTHRHHLFAQRRSVARESMALEIPDASAVELVSRLTARDTSPSNNLMRQERRERVLEALASLSPRDREVLVMRHLEHLSPARIAEVLGITPRAVEGRLLRALTRVRGLLESET